MQSYKTIFIFKEGDLFIRGVGCANDIVREVVKWVSSAPHAGQRKRDGLFALIAGAPSFAKNTVVIIAKEHPGDAMAYVEQSNLGAVARND